jgi:hypothetical protein
MFFCRFVCAHGTEPPPCTFRRETQIEYRKCFIVRSAQRAAATWPCEQNSGAEVALAYY